MVQILAGDIYGATPLMYAAYNGHIEMVKLLLAHDANPNAKTYNGKTAASVADDRGHEKIVALLPLPPSKNCLIS